MATDDAMQEDSSVHSVSGGKPQTAAPGKTPGELAIDKLSVEKPNLNGITPQEKIDALDYFLDETPVEISDFLEVLEVNAGTDVDKKIMEWTIRPLDGDTFQALRKRATPGNRQQKRSAEVEIDMPTMYLAMVAAATVVPDLDQVLAVKHIDSADPLHEKMQIIANRFAHKPGVIDQIAGKVMLLSGYDEDDVVRAQEDVKLVRAAGN